jgi:gamma-glutamyltranspeptidase/glutathione hydrolase
MKKILLPLLVYVGITSTTQAGTAAVAMPDLYGAQAARRILELDGNAIDAAVASAFVLAVTSPESGNIGGGGFMLSRFNGKPAFLDFRERAPQAAQRDMYLDEEGNFVQSLSLIGGKASGVPGTVRGLQEAHTRYGSLPWKELLQPAITLARDGFAVPEDLAEYAQAKVDEVQGETNFAEHFGALITGPIFKQPELARTLTLIADDPDHFYQGSIADKIVVQS